MSEYKKFDPKEEQTFAVLQDNSGEKKPDARSEQTMPQVGSGKDEGGEGPPPKDEGEKE